MPSPDLRRAGVYKGVAQAYRRKEQTMSREKQIEEMDEREWITVEERWPETDGYYLVWNKEKRKIEIRFFHLALEDEGIVNPIHPFRWAMLDGEVQLRF
jgi:hypothetical protein